MKRITRQSLVLIALAAGLAILLASQDRLLAGAGAGRAAAYAPDVSGLVSERRLEAAALQSANLHYEDGNFTTDDFLDEVGSFLKEACATGQAHEVVAFCNRHRTTPELIRKWNAAKVARASATSDADHAEAIGEYEAVLAFLRTLQQGPGTDGWMARAKEGIAYAHLKRGEIAAAGSVIRDALSLDDTSSWVRTTAIKVRCAEGADATQIRAEHRRMRRRLDAYIEKVRVDGGLGGPYDLRNALIERRIVERDRELFEMCRYARLRPMTAGYADGGLEPRVATRTGAR